MIAALHDDLEKRFAHLVKTNEIAIMVAHTQNYREADIFAEELRAAFPNIPVTHIDPLSLSVSCHIGPGALACACARVIK